MGHRHAPSIPRRRALLAGAVLAVTALPGCAALRDVVTVPNPDPDPSNLLLHIEAKDWNGWESPDPNTPAPPPDEKDLVVSEGLEASLPGSNISTVTITAVESQSVSFRTSVELSRKNYTGGFGLNSGDTEWRISTGEQMKLSTPTMDAGTTYTFTLLSSPSSPAPSSP